MRTDVTSLLDKLERPDFRYRQFADAIADLEPWPLFEALLADERVTGKRRRGDDAAVRDDAPGFLAGYDGTVGTRGGDVRQAEDGLRAFLQTLSDQPADQRS
jgi:hypothetical protein